jgi:malate/lactate dehydrogenase
LWSLGVRRRRSAQCPVADRDETLNSLREKIEKDVRYANITIIEGHSASQYGIGIVSARIAELILRDEHAIVPIGSYQREFGGTLSLPSVVGHCKTAFNVINKSNHLSASQDSKICRRN